MDNVRIVTGNVYSFLQARKLRNLNVELERNKLDILGMSEVCLRVNMVRVIESRDYRIYYSGKEKNWIY